MPVPFRDAEGVDALGAAACLRLLASDGGTGAVAGLLLVDARAEPLEFVHHAVVVPGGPLWSDGERWRHAARRVVAAVFGAAGRTPVVLLCAAGELPGGLLDLELGTAVPVAVVGGADAAGRATTWRWAGAPPPPDSPAAALVTRLADRDLLTEPLARAERALRAHHAAALGPASAPAPEA